MSKRILIVVTQLEAGGAQMASIKLRNGLVQRGLSAEVYFLYLKSDFEGMGSNCLLNHKPKSPFDYLRILMALFLLVRKKKPNTLITLTYFANVFGQLVGLIAGVPNRIASQRNPYDAIPSFLKPVDLIFGHLGIFKVVVMVSASVQSSFQKASSKYLARCVIIPNGVVPFDKEVCRRDYNLSESDFVVIHVGRFSKEKNHQMLLQAMPESATIHLVLIGDGELREEYERKYQDHQNIHFLGQVSQDQVKSYLAISDLFVLPSIYEGMSNALIEALVMGLPTLVSDIPSNEEVLYGEVKEAMLPIDDADTWKKEILRLSKKGNDYSHLKEHCIEIGANYGIDTMIDSFEKIV